MKAKKYIENVVNTELTFTEKIGRKIEKPKIMECKGN